MLTENQKHWDCFTEEVNETEWGTFPQLEIIYTGSNSAYGTSEKGWEWTLTLFGWTDQGEFVSFKKEWIEEEI